jgi:hypothetical protein
LLLAQAKKPSAAKKKAPAKKEAKKGGGKKKKSGFYSSEEEEESSEEEEEDSDGSTDDDDLVPKLQDDHALLLRVCLPLLRSRNSGVVLAVAALHHYVGPRDRAVLGRIGRALVRVMRGHREVTYVVLTNCVEFARAQPDMFRRYLKDFFIAVRGQRCLLLRLRRAGPEATWCSGMPGGVPVPSRRTHPLCALCERCAHSSPCPCPSLRSPLHHASHPLPPSPCPLTRPTCRRSPSPPSCGA